MKNVTSSFKNYVFRTGTLNLKMNMNIIKRKTLNIVTNEMSTINPD